MYTEYQPFRPMEGLRMGSQSADRLEQLPNRGVYCITSARRGSRNDAKSPGEDGEYRWAAYLPWGGEDRSIRPSSVSKYRRGTIDFLRDVQKYMRTIRKPPIIDRERPLQVRKVVKRNTQEKNRTMDRRETMISLAVNYIGNIDGKVAVVSKRMPLPPRPHPVDKTVCGLSKNSFVSEVTLSTFPASEPTTPTHSPKAFTHVCDCFSRLCSAHPDSTPAKRTLHRKVSLPPNPPRATSIAPRSPTIISMAFPQSRPAPLY